MKVSEECMTLDELKTITIDWYANLLRIKKVNQCENKELDFQLAIAETKLQSLGIPTENIKDKL